VALRSASGLPPKTSAKHSPQFQTGLAACYLIVVGLAFRQISDIDPHGSGYCIGSRSFGFGVTTSELVVTMAWGCIDEREARALGTAWQGTFAGPTRDTLVDVTHLAASDGPAFAALRDVLEPSREQRARVVRRQALIARDDFAAAFVHGYLAMFPPPYELRTFVAMDAALRWLGHQHVANEVAEIDALRHDLLARLRGWLDQTNLESASMELAVGDLGVTLRTMQRRLADASTRFAEELARAQVARAQRLMRDQTRKLSDIALEVGCGTPSSFSDLFRRITGETPSQWRRRLG